MLQRLKTRVLAPLALVAMGVSVPAAGAEMVTVSGIGSVNNQFGQRGGTIDALGAPAGFLVTFDPAAAPRNTPSPTTSIYQLTPFDLVADIGAHEMTLDPANAGHALLILSTGFGFFGGTSSEALINQTYQFVGPGGPTSPARLNGAPPVRDILSFTYTFRTGATILPTTLENLRDPFTADRGSFFYRADDGTNPGPFGFASGTAFGSFAAAPDIPEPDTWAMMIVGMFATGVAMRRRARPAATETA